MSKKPSYSYTNYPKLIAYLKRKGYPYEEYNDGFHVDGFHVKILGPNAAIELWPSRVKYHFVTAEQDKTGYYNLSMKFNEKELEEIL